MKFLIDEDVPVSVGEFLEGNGHEVLRVARDLLPGTKDPLVAQVADAQGAIVVTCNSRDFQRHIPQRSSGGGRLRYAGRITIRCKQSQALWRLQQVYDAIVEEYDRVQQRPDKRLLMDIAKDWYKVYR